MAIAPTFAKCSRLLRNRADFCEIIDDFFCPWNIYRRVHILSAQKVSSIIYISWAQKVSWLFLPMKYFRQKFHHLYQQLDVTGDIIGIIGFYLMCHLYEIYMYIFVYIHIRRVLPDESLVWNIYVYVCIRVCIYTYTQGSAWCIKYMYIYVYICRCVCIYIYT